MPKRCKTGEKVVSALKRGGHTQAWLARELGVAPAVLWRWIAGECTPRVDFALEIERLTGVSASLWIPKQKAA